MQERAINLKDSESPADVDLSTLDSLWIAL
jgi:hypothetical protein